MQRGLQGRADMLQVQVPRTRPLKGLDKRSQLKDRPCSPDDEEIEYDGADEEDLEED